MKKYKKSVNLLFVLLIIIFLVGCRVNNAPIITEIVTAKDIVEPGEQIQIEVKATDSEKDSLNVIWTATGGDIIGKGFTVEWKAPTTEGTYTITAKVSDGKLEVVREKNITVQIANQAPVITAMTSDKTIIKASEKINIQVIAEDPNENTLTYQWNVTGGTISGEGSLVSWTAPEKVGEYTITVIVSDGALNDTESISVQVLGAPEVEEIFPQVVSVGNILEITVQATDLNGDTLVYQWEDGNGNVLGNTSTLQWQAPDTYGVYSLIIKVSNQFYEVSQTVIVNVEDDTHLVPKIENIYFILFDDYYVTENDHLAVNQGYPFIPLIKNYNDNFSIEVQAETGEVMPFEEGFFWTTPSEPGEYNLKIILTDSIYTIIKNYPITVVSNSRPEIEDILVNNQILVNNFMQVEPESTLDIAINMSDMDNDQIECYVSGNIIDNLNTTEFSVVAPLEEGMYDFIVLISDGIQIQTTRFTIYVNDGIDNSISDINVINQVNNILEQFIVDFNQKNIDGILDYTHPQYKGKIQDILEFYYYWENVSDSQIVAETEVIQGASDDMYEVTIAIGGNVYLSWDDYAFNRIDSILLEFQDDGSGTILLKAIYDFF